MGQTRQMGLVRWVSLYGMLLLLSLLFLFPFYWLLISAFKNQAEIFSVPPMMAPHPVRWENFENLVRETTILHAFVNSVVIAVGNVGLALFLC